MKKLEDVQRWFDVILGIPAPSSPQPMMIDEPAEPERSGYFKVNAKVKKSSGLDKVIGYDDLKKVVRAALEADESFNMLFIGNPASGKSLFLEGILEEAGEDSLYIDATNTTSRFLDILEQDKPKVICIDELEKMPRNYQEKLLNFLESGRVKVDQMKRQYDFTIAGAKVFATANDPGRISKPMLSRFRPMTLPDYSEEEFVQVARKLFPEKREVIGLVARKVWMAKGDIREVRDIAKLIRIDTTPEEVCEILDTMKKYSGERGG